MKVLASSRQTFAFARDGGLPLSWFIHQINPHTKTPVNGVWIGVFIALCLGLLAFAGSSAINAVFSLGLVAQYIAFSIPIAARLTFRNYFKPGPFYLGKFVNFKLFYSYDTFDTLTYSNRVGLLA